MTVKVGVIMGSDSDWPVMEGAVDALKSLGVGVEATVVSAHRTPDRLMDYAKSARDRGLDVIIAGSGGASSASQVEAADILRDRGLRRVGPYRVTQTMGSTVSACLATPFKIKGVNYSISSACSTSAHCIGNRRHLVPEMIVTVDKPLVSRRCAPVRHGGIRAHPGARGSFCPETRLNC